MTAQHVIPAGNYSRIAPGGQPECGRSQGKRVIASERPVRPEFFARRGARPYVATHSNTGGDGVAYSPAPQEVARRQRMVQPMDRVFEKRRFAGLAMRIRRRAELVFSSPGMALLGGLAIVLSLGCSPLILADSPAESASDEQQSIAVEEVPAAPVNATPAAPHGNAPAVNVTPGTAR